MKLLLVIGLSLWVNLASAQTLVGKVIHVADGDTITVLDNRNNQYKIRLSGIDAPEKKQAFGNVSKQSLDDLVYGKEVVVDYNKQDRYGRTVGKVFISDKDVNLEQVKRGLAWFYKKYQNEMTLEDRLLYLHAQELSERAKLGLWKDREPISPWDFRKGNHS